MRKPTIRDIARVANLSPATVDRALNGRGGVSRRALEKIRSAAIDLGYGVPALDPLKPRAKVMLILPGGDYGFPGNIRDAARAAARGHTDIDVVLEIASVPLTPETLVEQLNRVQNGGFQAVGLFAIDVPEVRDAINQCEMDGIRVVTLVSDVPSSARHQYVGIDNTAAGRTAGGMMSKFLTGKTGKVAVITGSMHNRDHSERFFGFRERILSDNPGLSVLPVIETNSLNNANFEAVSSICEENPDLLGIYTVTGGIAGVIAGIKDQMLATKPILIAHELTTETRRGLISGDIELVINQSAKQIGINVVDRMLDNIFPNVPSLSERKVSIGIELFVADNLPVEA